MLRPGSWHSEAASGASSWSVGLGMGGGRWAWESEAEASLEGTLMLCYGACVVPGNGEPLEVSGDRAKTHWWPGKELEGNSDSNGKG